MTLDKFCHGRLVVLRASASAVEAARAMTNNHVGAVLVVDRRRLTGIVTDRDLMLKIVAANFKPSRIPIGQIMTREPVTLDRADTIEQALAVMHAMHVRRVVILDGGHPAGLVTLDDLILSGAVHPHRLRDVVFGQLSEGAPAKPEGFTGPMRLRRHAADSGQRRASRRAQTLQAFTQHVKKVTGLKSDADAQAAFEVVASALVRRLTAHEAGDFLAQLPALVRERLGEASRGGPDRTVTRQSIERDMRRRLKVWPPRAAELVSRVGHAMGEFVSAGELADVQSQLPEALKPLFGRAA
jgi:uncharacterized protein (DUF2267 family)